MLKNKHGGELRIAPKLSNSEELDTSKEIKFESKFRMEK
jgi:hypothetical protein